MIVKNVVSENLEAVKEMWIATCLFLAKYRTSMFEGNVVFIPYLWSVTGLSCRSFLGFVVVGKLWLYKGLPISNLFRSNMPRNWTWKVQFFLLPQVEKRVGPLKLWGSSWLWWVCVCRWKCVPEADNSLTSSGMLFRVSSFPFDTCCTLLFPDAFSKEALIPTCSLHSEFAAPLVASRPEDAFNDVIANSILGATRLSIAVKIAFCILSSIVSTILLISLSTFSLKHLSKVFTFTVLSLVAVVLLKVLAVKSRSLVPSLTTGFSWLSLAALPRILSWSKSSNWLRRLLFDCLFLRAETVCFIISIPLEITTLPIT